MKRRNDNFWRRWFVVGAAVFILYLIISLFNLLFFPLNPKEPLSNGDFWEYIVLSIVMSAELAGALMVCSLLIHFLFNILFPLITRTIRIPFYEPRNYHWENEYLKEKKTIWTILKGAIPFILFFPTSQIILAYVSSIIEGKKIIWDTLPQVFLIGMGFGLIFYIFVLFMEAISK
ncbi:MAG: hypothetical protein AAFQ91_11240 [Cyanobacteria bacterium J06621_15]